MKEEIEERQKRRTYSTDERGDEEPAILKQRQGRISDHVLNVVQKTVCTYSIVVRSIVR